MNEKRIYWIGATIVLVIMVVCGIVTGISYATLNETERAIALIAIWRWVIGIILYQVIYIPVSIQAFKKEEKQNDC